MSELPSRFRLRRALLTQAVVGIVAFGAVVGSVDAQQKDLLSLSLEQLLEVKVVTASRYEQAVSEVAAAPQVITARQIRNTGAKTLADVLSQFPGLHVQSDGVYTRVGVRGFLRPSDYNARLLLLVNGRRLNEVIYGGAYFGEEGPIDVSLIERVEFVPGPGSSVYGSNALLGVVNVITQPGQGPAGTSAAVDLYDPRAVRAEGAIKLKTDSGVGGTLQLSRYESKGRRRGADELIGLVPVDTQAAGRDSQWSNRVYVGVESGALSAQALYVNRETNIANGAYFSEPSVSAQPNRDRLATADVGYSMEVGPQLKLSGRLAASEYQYRGRTAVRDEITGEILSTTDVAKARWVDVEGQVVSRWRPDATLVAGVEVTRSSGIQLLTQASGSSIPGVDEAGSFTRWGGYVQNDWSPLPAISTSIGVRVDGESGRARVASPRLGAVLRPSADTDIKAQFGKAFRAPNAYERFYATPDNRYRVNPALREETVKSFDMTVEHRFASNVSARVSGFRNAIRGLIDLEPSAEDGALEFRNKGAVTLRGVLADAVWSNAEGWQVKAGAALHRARAETQDGGQEDLRFSPKRLATLSLMTPRRGGVSGGLHVQYTGPQSGRDANFGGYALMHGAVNVENLVSGLDATLGVRNLFDRRFAYPLGDESVPNAERGETRQLWIGLRYRY